MIGRIYLIGSLRNDRIPHIGQQLRESGYDVFDDWFAAGPEADDYWQRYEKHRGHDYRQALQNYSAKHVFNFDNLHLSTSDACILALPAGKSGHLEFGWMIGQGKPGWILLDGEPDRYDVMYQFANGVFFSVKELVEGIQNYGS